MDDFNHDHEDELVLNEDDLIFEGDKIEVSMGGRKSFLPDINMRFLERQAKINENATLLNEQSKELMKKRIEILKRYLNRKHLSSNEVTLEQQSSLHLLQQMSSNDSFAKRVRKHVFRAGAVPEYLKEDHPSKNLHDARLEARRLNESLKGISPTA
jgi:hypothetical protein